MSLSNPQAFFVLGHNGGTLLFLLIHLNFIQFKASSRNCHFLSLKKCFIKFIAMTLVSKTTQVSSIHLHNMSSVRLFLWLIFMLGVTKGTFTSLVQEHHLLVNSGNSGYTVHRKPDHWFLVWGSGLWLMYQDVKGERGVYSGPVSVSHIEAGLCAFIYRAAGI